MSMFSKLKEINEFRNQAKKLQGELATLIVEKRGSKVTAKASGNMEIVDLHIEEGAPAEEVRSTINGALKEAQKAAAQHMRASGGLNLPGR